MTTQTVTFKRCRHDGHKHYTPAGEFIREDRGLTCSAGGCPAPAQAMVLVDDVYYGPCVCSDELHAPAVIEIARWLAERPWRSLLGVSAEAI
jgi:hypothetical protein